MVTTHRPAVDTAVAFLKQRVTEGRLKGQSRLPTVRVMARAAGVSPVTMLRAVADIKEAENLESAPSRGLRIKDIDGQQTAFIEQGRNHVTQRTKVRIIEDLRSGHHPFGRRLPPVKECAARYGCCVTTLRRAFDDLVGQDILKRDGRGYSVPGSTPGSFGRIVVLFALSDPDGMLLFTIPRQETYVTVLEQECVRAGLSLHISGCHHTDRGLAATPASGGFTPVCGGPDRIAGYIIWAAGLSHEFIRNLVADLAPARRPIAVLDESTGLPPMARPPLTPLRVWNMPVNLEPGVAMGRHLARLGHRRIAFIWGQDSAGWADSRREGVCAGAAGTDPDTAVVNFHADTYTPAATQSLRDQAQVEFKEMTSLLQKRGRVSFSSSFGVRSENAMYMEIRRELLARCLDPLLRRALADRSITAWVGANDEYATTAMQFLRNNRRRIPGDIALAGFDNSPAAVYAGLTSYDFGGDAAMHAMMEFIVRPASPLLRAGNDVTVVNGYVRIRETA